MSYKLAFRVSAKKEWDKLDASVREPFKKKLLERLEQPRVPSAALYGMQDCYKIKLRRIGFRLIYEVSDSTITVTVVAVGRRDSIYGD